MHSQTEGNSFGGIGKSSSDVPPSPKITNGQRAIVPKRYIQLMYPIVSYRGKFPSLFPDEFLHDEFLHDEFLHDEFLHD